MADPPRRSPEWFLAKIAEGLRAADLAAEPEPARRRMSRAEIEKIVNETLERELARLDDPKNPENPENPDETRQPE